MSAKTQEMKYCLSILFFSFVSTLSAQIFVDLDATGTADGTSWENAYIELHDALENSVTGQEIWVAEGVYFPQSPIIWNDPDRKSFYIPHEIFIYGGFSGIETSFDERDPQENFTLLSGDLNSDDILGDFETNSDDNVLNVVFAESTSNGAIIDGFSIRGGRAIGGFSLPSDQRGGGVYTLGEIHIQNCKIAQNSALAFGGGVYFRLEGTEGSSISNCIIDSNYAGQNGGGVVLANVLEGGIDISETIFIENVAIVAGGGLYSSNSESEILGCEFLGNSSFSVGGGMYILVDDGGALLTTLVFDSHFEGNASTRGGGINFRLSSTNAALSVSSSDFISNQSFTFDPGVTFPRGGGINADFTGNSANGIVHIEGCSFIENDASNWGGGISLFMDAFGANTNHNVLVEGCEIKGNSANVYGGGIWVYNNNGAKDKIEILNCSITENHAESDAGGMGVITLNEVNDVAIRSSIFSANSSINALAFRAWRGNANTTLPEDQRMEISNCVFKDHVATSAINYLIGGTDFIWQMQNNTIANNESRVVEVGLGSELFVQNNIFFNTSPYETFKFFGNSELVSGGGNLINDASLDGMITNFDFQETEPQFEPGELTLSETSPAIDAGVIPDDFPIFDAAGNSRIQGGCIDIGAYESSFDLGGDCGDIFSAVNENEITADVISIYPNPASEEIKIAIETEFPNEMQVSILNAYGQVVSYSEWTNKGAGDEMIINIASLSHGVYQLLVSSNKIQKAYSFVKS